MTELTGRSDTSSAGPNRNYRNYREGQRMLGVWMPREIFSELDHRAAAEETKAATLVRRLIYEFLGNSGVHLEIPGTGGNYPPQIKELK